MNISEVSIYDINQAQSITLDVPARKDLVDAIKAYQKQYDAYLASIPSRDYSGYVTKLEYNKLRNYQETIYSILDKTIKVLEQFPNKYAIYDILTISINQESVFYISYIKSDSSPCLSNQLKTSNITKKTKKSLKTDSQISAETFPGLTTLYQSITNPIENNNKLDLIKNLSRCRHSFP